MPRYEKSGRSRDNLFELDLADRFVYVAEGSRAKGADEWEFTERGRRTMLHDHPAAAKVAFDTKCAELVGKKYVLAGADSPHASAWRIRHEHQRQPPKDEASRALADELRSAGTIRWTHPGGDVLQIRLDGANLHIQRGGKTAKTFHPSPDRAIGAGVTELTIARDVWGYRP